MPTLDGHGTWHEASRLTAPCVTAKIGSRMAVVRQSIPDESLAHYELPTHSGRVEEWVNMATYGTLLNGTALPSDLVRRVGFLRSGEPFDTGAVFERLCELTQNPWQPWLCAGVHHCDLCQFTGNSVVTYVRIVNKQPGSSGYRVSASSSTVDLWIPGNGFLYV
jgi:hypothetical protein